MKHGFQAQVAYSYSKSLDDDSQSIAGDSFANLSTRHGGSCRIFSTAV